MARDTYKYHFKVGNEILYTGITNDLEDRERTLQITVDESGYIKQVGSATTKDSALKWESAQTEKGLPTRRNRNANVIRLVDVTDRAKHWSVPDMLEDFLNEVATAEEGRIRPHKAILVFLDDTTDEYGTKYDVGFRQAGMRASEAIALLEVCKTSLLKTMGYIPDE